MKKLFTRSDLDAIIVIFFCAFGTFVTANDLDGYRSGEDYGKIGMVAFFYSLALLYQAFLARKDGYWAQRLLCIALCYCVTMVPYNAIGMSSYVSLVGVAAITGLVYLERGRMK